MSDREDLHAAFGELRRLGYETSEGSWCCSSCTVADFDTNKFVYWNEQDDVSGFAGTDTLGCDMYIGWGQDGNAAEIGGVLERHGFEVKLPESVATRILLRGKAA